MSQDTLTGLLAPVIVFMMATRPSVLSYALGVSFFVFGIVDFTNGLVVEANLVDLVIFQGHVLDLVDLLKRQLNEKAAH